MWVTVSLFGIRWRFSRAMRETAIAQDEMYVAASNTG